MQEDFHGLIDPRKSFLINLRSFLTSVDDSVHFLNHQCREFFSKTDEEDALRHLIIMSCSIQNLISVHDYYSLDPIRSNNNHENFDYFSLDHPIQSCLEYVSPEEDNDGF